MQQNAVRSVARPATASSGKAEACHARCSAVVQAPASLSRSTIQGPNGAPCRVRNQARDTGHVADGLQLDDGVGQVLQADGEGRRVEA